MGVAVRQHRRTFRVLSWLLTIAATTVVMLLADYGRWGLGATVAVLAAVLTVLVVGFEAILDPPRRIAPPSATVADSTEADQQTEQPRPRATPGLDAFSQAFSQGRSAKLAALASI